MNTAYPHSHPSGERDQAARRLARAHRCWAPEVKRIFRVLGDETNEPIKLLEVNPHTFAGGILPVYFASDPPDLPFPSIVMEVTEEELERVSDGSLALPHGWRLDAEVPDPD